MTFKKGDPKPENSGRRRGTPNKRTIYVREVLEGAAEAIGGMQRLIAWIKEAPENEYAFWTSMFMRLLPVHIKGSGEHGELILEVRHEELVRKMEERGLPPIVFGVDEPVLELEAEKKTNGDARKH
jgi:hypothetical protein